MEENYFGSDPSCFSHQQEMAAAAISVFPFSECQEIKNWLCRYEAFSSCFASPRKDTDPSGSRAIADGYVQHPSGCPVLHGTIGPCLEVLGFALGCRQMKVQQFFSPNHYPFISSGFGCFCPSVSNLPKVDKY